MSEPVRPESVIPEPDEIRRLSHLRQALRRIDGWGTLAWREIMGGWRGAHGVLAITYGENDGPADEDQRIAWLVIDHQLAVKPADSIAAADWVLREMHRTHVPRCPIHVEVLPAADAVRATTACRVVNGQILLRLDIELPALGMGIDARRFGRFVTWCEKVAADFAAVRQRAELRQHCRSVARQQALRAALPTHGLIAFIGDGSQLPRGLASSAVVPLRAPAALAVRIDLGRFGAVRGWGIRQGVTAVVGAPYHGKSTVLKALQAGIYDHPPGDGRELVVSDASTLLVQAEDGRLVRETDVSGFFRALPGADARHFATTNASGATSMAASLIQGMAAGARLLLVDEDTAAGNILAIDGAMRQLLGRSLRGVRTLAEILPALAAQGVSTVVVAGSSAQALSSAQHVIVMDDWQPRRAKWPVAKTPHASFAIPQRLLEADPNAVFGPRHFTFLDLREPERPRLKLPDGWHTLDLRRCGWPLDAGLVAGALLAAGWCCRLAAHQPMAAVHQAFVRLIVDPSQIDPFHTRAITVPPWQLVVAVLERLPLNITLSRSS